MRLLAKTAAAMPQIPHRCDRCGGEFEHGSYLEPFRFSFRAGYASPFGDGRSVEGQYCLKCIEQVYRPYLRRMLAETIPSTTIQCDRCGKIADKDYDGYTWQEFFTLRYVPPSTNPNNLFDFGPTMETDLCADCTKTLMGAYLRITQDYEAPGESKVRRYQRPRWVYQQIQLDEEWERRHERDWEVME